MSSWRVHGWAQRGGGRHDCLLAYAATSRWRQSAYMLSQHATGGRREIQQLAVSSQSARQAASNGQHRAHIFRSMWEKKNNWAVYLTGDIKLCCWDAWRANEPPFESPLSSGFHFGGFLPPSSGSHRLGNDNGLGNPAADEGPAAAGRRQSEQCEWSY